MDKALHDLNMPVHDGTGIIISGHFKEKDNYSVVRKHGMKDWLITFTLSGEGVFIIDEQEYPVQSGDIAMIKGGTPHAYRTHEDSTWNFVWAHFVPSIQELEWMQLAESQRGFIMRSVHNNHLQERIYHAFQRILEDSKYSTPYANELCMNAIQEILLLLSQMMSVTVDPRISEIMHVLSSRMKEPLKIEELAKEIGLSPSRLSHLFKAETGSTIVQTLIGMRLRQSALLLKHTPRSAAEIAWDVGFQNYNHFARQFKRKYNMNPLEFRNRSLE